MHFHTRLSAVFLALATTCLATLTTAQEISPKPASGNVFLPPPLEALGPRTAEELKHAKNIAAEIGPEAQTQVPANAVEELPVPDVAPSAIRRFSAGERRVRLVRGNEVVELSNSALRNSGAFEMALKNSPELALSYQRLQTHTLRVEHLKFQAQRAEAAGEGGLKDSLDTAFDNERGLQELAQAQFEEDLWNYGLNGAKVGTVMSLDRPTAAEPDGFVMVQAIGDSPSNNLGYMTTQVYATGELGATTVASEYLLPFPVEANDLFYDKGAASFTQRAPDGLMIPLTADPTINPIVQFLVKPQAHTFYDTGFVHKEVAKRNFAEGVSLGSRRDPGAGQMWLISDIEEFSEFTNVDMAMNTQLMDIGGGNSVQFFTVANNDLRDDVLGLSSLGVRAYNRQIGSAFEGWSLVVGKKQSIFGETSVTPAGATIDRTLVGTVNRTDNIAQIGFVAPLSNYFTWKAAIEDPHHEQSDVLYDATIGFTRLNRWPTLATSLVFEDKATNNLLQLGGLVRSNGFELDATGEEFFETGWGLSAITELRDNNGVTFFGVAGGDGVGLYIEGIQLAAAANTTTGFIDALSAFGAFAGRQVWWYDACNNPIAVCNAAYGYSLMEHPDTAVLDRNRKLHQAWLNCTRFIGDRLGVGLEYQYGYREIGSGDVGEDHRFLMVISLRTAPTTNSTQVQSFVAMPAVTGAGGVDADLPPPGPAPDTLQAMEATIDGRAARDVVNQYQRGGAAFQQRL